MAVSHAFVPYLERQASPEAIGEGMKIFSSNFHKFFPNADRIDQIIHREEDVKQAFESLAEHSTKNRIITHHLQLKRFYKEVFEEDIDMKLIKSPHTIVLRYLMYISPGLTREILFAGAKKLLRIDIQKSEIEVAFQKDGTYTFSYNGLMGPDKKLLLEEGQTVRNLVRREWKEKEWIGKHGMTCFEYLLCACFRYWLSGKLYDENGRWTIFSNFTETKAVIAQSQGVDMYTFTTIDLDTTGTHPPTGMRGTYIF